MGYIQKERLEALYSYAYKGVDKSILSKYVLNPYWTWLVSLWPTWVAPNTITLTGLSLVFMNFITMLYYDPAYYTEKHGSGLPHWIYFTWAAGLFLYQSLDAIDGKQARRTGMAGPLGQMFDHGCDALNTTLEVILAAHALNLGRSWWTVASQIATLANFYLTTWEEYHTGQLFLGVFSGPVEGILMIVGIYVISGIYGPSFWDRGILDFLHINQIGGLGKVLPDVPLNEAFMIFGALGLTFNIFTSYSNVLKAVHSSRSHSTSPISAILPFLRLLPFPLSAAIHLFWLAAPSLNPATSAILHSSLFVPFLCAWGLQFAHQVGRMILAHVTKRPGMPWFELMWVVSLLGGLDANMPGLFGRDPFFQTTQTRIAIAVYTVLALSFITYGRFCYLVINDITNYLGIACFTVRKKDSHGVWRSTVPQVNGKSSNGVTMNGDSKKHT